MAKETAAVRTAAVESTSKHKKKTSANRLLVEKVAQLETSIEKIVDVGFSLVCVFSKTRTMTYSQYVAAYRAGPYGASVVVRTSD